MSEPLTLKQWGEHIGQINRTAQREYHRHIFKRGGQVREALFQSGAVSVRQLPQDLLRRSTGDPGRRCYPLALLMGAAVAAGGLAERALIGRVANASLRPEDVDSRALLSALDELGEVSGRAIGQARGRQNLDSVMQTLEAKTAPAPCCSTQAITLCWWLKCKWMSKRSIAFMIPILRFMDLPQAQK